jgi:universal stress protein A
MIIRTILHPTDFSRYSENAWRVACSLARDYGANLLVLHVREIPVAVYGEFGTVPADTFDAGALRDELAKLEPTVSGVTVERRLTEGTPAAEIVRVAGENNCDLIVLGTHGRTGLGRLLMGSVAEQVVRRATCPVLTVKTPMPEKVDVTAAEMEAETEAAIVP